MRISCAIPARAQAFAVSAGVGFGVEQVEQHRTGSADPRRASRDFAHALEQGAHARLDREDGLLEIVAHTRAEPSRVIGDDQLTQIFVQPLRTSRCALAVGFHR
jgi:hypothetical protein